MAATTRWCLIASTLSVYGQAAWSRSDVGVPYAPVRPHGVPVATDCRLRTVAVELATALRPDAVGLVRDALQMTTLCPEERTPPLPPSTTSLHGTVSMSSTAAAGAHVLKASCFTSMVVVDRTVAVAPEPALSGHSAAQSRHLARCQRDQTHQLRSC
jgi:hypothetical protein